MLKTVKALIVDQSEKINKLEKENRKLKQKLQHSFATIQDARKAIEVRDKYIEENNT